FVFFFFQAEDGIRDLIVTGVQTCALPIFSGDRGTVAKVPAQVLPLEKAEAGSGYSTNTDQAGNKALTGIFFGGKKYQLSIGEARSEERRVGKECRTRWARGNWKKKKKAER